MVAFSLRKVLLVVAGLALFLVADSGQAQSGSPGATGRSTSIQAGFISAETVIEKLRYIVEDLAGQKASWNDTLYPSIDVFLIGVDASRPVGVDVIFDPADDEGARNVFYVPLANLKEFLDDNLAPIDILSKKAPGKSDYYRLESETLEWKGFLRVVDNYASISEKEAEIPAGMPSPQLALDNLLKTRGFDAAARVRNSSEGIVDREASFATFRDKMLEKVKKRTTETADDYALRRTLAEQQLDRLQRLFVQSEEVLAAWTTDTQKHEARGNVHLQALAGTDLAALVARCGAQPSYFHGVATGPESLLSARVNFPLDDFLRGQFSRFYDLARPVWKAKINEQKRPGKDVTDANIAARQQIADVLLVMLKDGLSLDAIDGFVELTPESDGTHTVVLGIRAADGTKAIEILNLLGPAVNGWTVTLNADSQSGAAIHKLEFSGNLPEAVKKFYGGSMAFYVATSPEAVWVSGGNNALAKLKATIEAVSQAEKKADGNIASLSVRLGPTLTHLDELAQEEGFDLKEWLGRKQPSSEEAEAAEGDQPRRRPAQALASFDWRGVALPELKGAKADRLQISLRHDGKGRIEGVSRVERDILKTAGKVISRIADEKLGSGR